MCAAVEVVHADDDADKTGDGDMITVELEAAQLFHDDGRQRGFTPGVVARLMPGLLEQRQIRQFCDVVFRATDGSEIWAHRLVLATKYSGCYVLFTLAEEGVNPEQKRKNESTPPIRVVVGDLNNEMIKLLVDFAYHVPLHEHIGRHNVGNVLELAEKLKLIRIRDHCLNTLKQNLEPESCVDTYHLASRCGYENLAGESFRYLLRNFGEVWKNSAQFPSLTPEELRTLLEDNRLYAPKELEDTFPAILKWISADVAGRTVYLAKLLPLVRFARCSVTDFEKVITNEQVQGDGGSLEVLSVIHQTLSRQSMTVGEVAGVDLSPKLWLTPRLPKDILFLFGGWTTATTNRMLTYNCRTAKWRVMGNQNTPPRANHGAAVIGQCVYFVGGFDGRVCYHSVVCFDVRQARWSAKANMAFARCYVSVAVLQGHIYAMGGFDGRARLKTVERYDVKKNRWSMVADMNEVRSDASAAAACGRIYIAGGYTGRVTLDTVECYDPSTDAWTLVLTLPFICQGLKAVAHKNMIYLIGGYGFHGYMSSMTLLDIRRARVSDLPAMPRPKMNFAAVVLEGQIYVIGGHDGVTTQRTVERYDIEAGKWHSAPEIDVSCSAAAAFVVCDVGNAESWI
ncbi:kelch-like protein 10 isoform X2 [Dermacentor albipictus]|uniref:kelch-like protein 10 isoform X2 n=1 Tax=Dermacentor albipictus TaxID=60249 RepID=UPI0038FCA190